MMVKKLLYAWLPAIAVLFLSFDVPKYWFKSGSDPVSYDAGIDPGAGPNGKNVATIKSIEKKPKGFGSLMQVCLPEKYLGKRVRMSGYMKTKDVADWASFWLKIDQKNTDDTTVVFDNMSNRAIKGTTDWARYDIVLDVSSKAIKLSYGAMLNGKGQIWFDRIAFETVDHTVPTTELLTSQSSPLKEPSNLDFSEK